MKISAFTKTSKQVVNRFLCNIINRNTNQESIATSINNMKDLRKNKVGSGKKYRVNEENKNTLNLPFATEFYRLLFAKSFAS